MTSYGQLEGASVRANDGTFLGRITTQTIDPEAITNPVGVHGNEISGSSIFNRDGLYGNEISPLSAFNGEASDPPQVFRDGRFLGFMSINPGRSPRFDPREVFAGLHNGKH